MGLRHRGRDAEGQRDPDAGAGGLRGVGGKALRRALALNELTAQFQPIVSTESGTVVGLEALVRWQRADGRLLAARDFLEAAVRDGVVSQVDHRTMAVVARTLVRNELPDGLEWISVNLAPNSLGDREVTRRAFELADEMERFGLRLVVEIPELAAGTVPAGTTEVLDAFRASGMRVALDDFGRSPLRLDRLLHFPVDMVKIDGRGPPVETHRLSDQRGYARALAGLCRSLGRTVVLERVEAAPRRADSPIGEADFVQGHYFGRPAFLERRR